MHVGSLLQQTRAERGIGQAELARRAGTTQTYVSRVERGVVSPSLTTLDRLFHAMGHRLSLHVEPLPHGNRSRRELRADLDDRLRPHELLATLRRHQVDFVVIGAFALAPHGYVRTTADLDIVPDPDDENLRRLAAALRDLDAGLEPDAQGLSAGGNWGLATRHGRLDVMQDVPGLRSWNRLRTGAVEVDGVLYAGYDELISMKVASGREEDLRDVGALEAGRRDG